MCGLSLVDLWDATWLTWDGYQLQHDVALQDATLGGFTFAHVCVDMCIDVCVGTKYIDTLCNMKPHLYYGPRPAMWPADMMRMPKGMR